MLDGGGVFVEGDDLGRGDDLDFPCGFCGREAKFEVEGTGERAKEEVDGRATSTACGGGEVDDVVGGTEAFAGASRSTASGIDVPAPDTDGIGEEEASAIAELGAKKELAPPLDTELPLKVDVGFDDAGFDQDLRGLGVEVAGEAFGAEEEGRVVFDDQDVGAGVDGDITARAENGANARHHFLGIGVVDGDQADLLGLRKKAGFLEFLPFFFFFSEFFEGGDPDDIAFFFLSEFESPQDHVEGLIPRDIAEFEGDLTSDIAGSDDIEAADLGEEAEEVMDIDEAEVHGDTAAAIAFARGLLGEGGGDIGGHATCSGAGLGDVLGMVLDLEVAGLCGGMGARGSLEVPAEKIALVFEFGSHDLAQRDDDLDSCGALESAEGADGTLEFGGIEEGLGFVGETGTAKKQGEGLALCADRVARRRMIGLDQDARTEGGFSKADLFDDGGSGGGKERGSGGVGGGSGSLLEGETEAGAANGQLGAKGRSRGARFKDKANFAGVPSPTSGFDGEAFTALGGEGKALLKSVEIQDKAGRIPEFKKFVGADASVGLKAESLGVWGDPKEAGGAAWVRGSDGLDAGTPDEAAGLGRRGRRRRGRFRGSGESGRLWSRGGHRRSEGLKSRFGCSLGEDDGDRAGKRANGPARGLAEVNDDPPKRSVGTGERLDLDQLEGAGFYREATLKGLHLCLTKIDHEARGLLEREGGITKRALPLKEKGGVCSINV